jgi:hypothetical protein
VAGWSNCGRHPGEEKGKSRVPRLPNFDAVAAGQLMPVISTLTPCPPGSSTYPRRPARARQAVSEFLKNRISQPRRVTIDAD